MPSTRNHVILSICMSQVNEWDQNNVIMTGGTDGVIRVYIIFILLVISQLLMSLYRVKRCGA